MHVCPPQVAPDFIRVSPLADAAGWVDVDQTTLRHKSFDNIWSLGDVMNAPNAKTAAAARKQAPVVADNIVADIEGRGPVAAYDGYGSGPLTVERGKILANQPDHPEPKIDLRILERGLSVPLTPADLQSSLNAETTEILTHASETLALADLSPERVDRIILVGGSSLLNDISDGLQVLCPNAQIEADNAMTAIADGLALAAETAFA